jgi:hypothetical protein
MLHPWTRVHKWPSTWSAFAVRSQVANKRGPHYWGLVRVPKARQGVRHGRPTARSSRRATATAARDGTGHPLGRWCDAGKARERTRSRSHDSSPMGVRKASAFPPRGAGVRRTARQSAGRDGHRSWLTASLSRFRRPLSQSVSQSAPSGASSGGARFRTCEWAAGFSSRVTRCAHGSRPALVPKRSLPPARQGGHDPHRPSHGRGIPDEKAGRPPGRPEASGGS